MRTTPPLEQVIAGEPGQEAHHDERQDGRDHPDLARCVAGHRLTSQLTSDLSGSSEEVEDLSEVRCGSAGLAVSCPEDGSAPWPRSPTSASLEGASSEADSSAGGSACGARPCSGDVLLEVGASAQPSDPPSASSVDGRLGGYLEHVEALVIALIIVAGILAGVELVRSRGTSLICWAVEALAVALLLPVLASI